MVNNLNLIIWATGNDFPEARFIGEMPDLFDFQIGEMIHHLNLIIGKAAYELDAPVNLWEIDIFACHVDPTSKPGDLFNSTKEPLLENCFWRERVEVALDRGGWGEGGAFAISMNLKKILRNTQIHQNLLRD